MGPESTLSHARPASGGRLAAWLRLGRVSNLPTVWTNTLAAVCLTGEVPSLGVVAAIVPVMSAFYVAGMILNDVFDASYDAVHRPSRPIPSGMVSKRWALRVGLAGLALPTTVAGLIALWLEQPVWGALGMATLLAAAIVAYDVHHKNNPLSPVVMGACRALVYLTTAIIVSGGINAGVTTAAVLQWSYVVGLTYAAKQEDLTTPGSFWPVLFVLAPVLVVGLSLTRLAGWPLFVGPSPLLTVTTLGLTLGSIVFGLAPLVSSQRRIGEAVGRLLAGIAVVDALWLATTGWYEGVLLALLFAGLTRAAQRFVPGT